MLNRLIDRLGQWLLGWHLDRKVQQECEATPAIDWRALRDSISGDLEGYMLYLEMRDDSIRPLDAAGAGPKDVVGLIATWRRDGELMSPAGPAEELATRLSARPGMGAIVQISRSLDSFIGYYVRIRPLVH